MLPIKFWFIWPSGFRGEDLKKSANQKQELPIVAMFVNGLGQNEQSLERTFHRCFLPSFHSFGQAVSEQTIFLEINQSKTRIACGGHVSKRIGNKWAIFIEDLPRMLPTKFRFIWQSGYRGEDFSEINQSETRIACGMFVNGSGQNEQSLERTCHRCFLPGFGSFGQAVSEKIFKNRPIRIRNFSK